MTAKTVEDTILVEKGIFGLAMDHVYIAGPVVSAFILRKVVMITSVVAVGHLGAHYLASAGLASVTANVTGNSMVIGLSGALVTLCSQANGANDKKEMGLALQRSLIILSIFICLPASILWACSEPIMIALGQDERIARSTKEYMVVLIPGLWALSANQSINTWMYAQAKTQAVAMITLTVAILHPLWLYLFICFWRIGFLGAAIALSLTKCIELFILLVYLNVFSTLLVDSEFEWSWKCWTDWGPFLRLGLPNLLMMSEWWASEIIIFMSGALPNPEVQMGAMSIYQNLLALCFMLPAGVREACSTIVGNALGAGKAPIARHSSFIAPALGLLGCSILSAFIIPSGRLLGSIFSDDGDVIALVASLTPLIAAYIISDGQQACLTGVIKGVGKQGVGGPIVVFSYYAVAIPLSSYLALDMGGRGLGMGVKGLCIGTLVGTIVHMLLFAVVVYGFTDMDAEVIKFKEKSAAKELKDLVDSSKAETTVSPLRRGSGRDQMVAASSHGSEEGEADDAWWDDLSFLGIESKLPGRTAVSRGSSGGMLAAPAAAVVGAWNWVRSGFSTAGTAPSMAPKRREQQLQYAKAKPSSRSGGMRAAMSRLTGSGTPVGGGGRRSSEYELVRAYTDALSPMQLDGEEADEDFLEIDFDFI